MDSLGCYIIKNVVIYIDYISIVCVVKSKRLCCTMNESYGRPNFG